MDTEKSVMVARGKVGGRWVERGKGGENRDISNSVNNKKKRKNKLK